MGCRIVYSEMISFRDNIKSFTTEYIAGLDDLKEVTHEFSAMDSFQGKTATRVKDYMRDVSLVTIKGMRFLHEEFSNIIDAYVRGYLENIDPATDTIIDCDCLEELINDNHSAHQTFKEVNDEINAIIDESSLDLPEPSGGTINALYENITNNLVGLRTAVGEYEYAHRNDMAELSQLANALSNFMKAHAKFHTDVSNLPFSIPKDNFYNRLNDMVKDREERKSQLADESEHIVEEAPTTFIELKAQIIMLGNVPMLWWQMSLVKREEVYGVIKQATHDVRMQLSAEHQRIM
ncbi:MAG: LXG domain-containing protein, partial [Lachnospiraceae bacterium]|nr:LXG domain-containing protein [Lachnospiraceae bacterium]